MKRLICLFIVLSVLGTPVVSVSAQETGESASRVFDWPAPMPTETQIKEAQACDLQTLPAERYPEKLDSDELAAAFEPASACDWAVLATAYARRAGERQPPPEEGTQAYINAVSENPALAFSISLLAAGYFGAVELVESPFAGLAVTGVEIEHSWAGLGTPVRYSVTIRDADGKPAVSGTVEDYEAIIISPEPGVTPTPAPPFKLPDTIEAELVQALGAALADLLPMEQQFSDTPCWDNYPDWTVKLTFEDGTTVTMVTNESNVLFAGGPWQTEIDGQAYMQLSADFLIALLDVVKALGLPRGQTAAYGCGGYNDPLFEAFSFKSAG